MEDLDVTTLPSFRFFAGFFVGSLLALACIVRQTSLEPGAGGDSIVDAAASVDTVLEELIRQ